METETLKPQSAKSTHLRQKKQVSRRMACERCRSQKLRCIYTVNNSRRCERCVKASTECIRCPSLRMGRPPQAGNQRARQVEQEDPGQAHGLSDNNATGPGASQISVPGESVPTADRQDSRVSKQPLDFERTTPEDERHTGAADVDVSSELDSTQPAVLADGEPRELDQLFLLDLLSETPIANSEQQTHHDTTALFDGTIPFFEDPFLLAEANMHDTSATGIFCVCTSLGQAEARAPPSVQSPAESSNPKSHTLERPERRSVLPEDPADHADGSTAFGEPLSNLNLPGDATQRISELILEAHRLESLIDRTKESRDQFPFSETMSLSQKFLDLLETFSDAPSTVDSGQLHERDPREMIGPVWPTLRSAHSSAHSDESASDPPNTPDFQTMLSIIACYVRLLRIYSNVISHIHEAITSQPSPADVVLFAGNIQLGPLQMHPRGNLGVSLLVQAVIHTLRCTDRVLGSPVNNFHHSNDRPTHAAADSAFYYRYGESSNGSKPVAGILVRGRCLELLEMVVKKEEMESVARGRPGVSNLRDGIRRVEQLLRND